MKDEDYMRRAIALAKKAEGWTNPNPMVGAVVVKDGRIIGEGYHHRCGELHAERNALASCGESARGATIYVTLEPCCHYGKTPPCTEAIIEHQLAKVVIGSRDPNPLVSGKGAGILRAHGIEVQEDFLREECDAINPVFFHYISTKTPYVVMKYAMTADGKIATYTGKSKWITGDKAREHVHTLRHRYSGIMAGIGTVLADDPMLNCRLENGNSPIRIICDSHLRIPMESRLVTTAKDYQTIIACAVAEPDKIHQLEALGITVLSVPDDHGKRVDLSRLMYRLGSMGIDSVLVEGGADLNYSVMETGLVKKCFVYIGGMLFGGAAAKSPIGGSGIETPSAAIHLKNPQICLFGRDVLLEYDVDSGEEAICLPES